MFCHRFSQPVVAIPGTRERNRPQHGPRLDLVGCVFIFVLALLSCPYPASNAPRGSYRRSEIQSRSQPSERTPENTAKGSSRPTRNTAPTPGTNASSATQSCDSDTSIIIASSLIPSHPSLAIIDETITSVRQYLLGLCPTAPLIITVDGLVENKARRDVERHRWQEYVQNLQSTYGNQTNVTILISEQNMHLGGNLAKAMAKAVHTPFVYVLQHDLPFVRSVNHLAVREAMQAYPDDLRIVRFNTRPNEQRPHENHTCWGEVRDQPYSPFLASDGTTLRFTRTPLWSDRNHLTTVRYYKEVFTLLLQTWGHVHGFPERVMVDRGFANCSYFGTHLYGPENFPKVIHHSNGRLSQP